MRPRPSAAHRWIGGGCTGSVALEEGAVRLPPGESAAEGTRLHAIAAKALLTGEMPGDPDDYAAIEPYVTDVMSVAGELVVEVAVGRGSWIQGTPDAYRVRPDGSIIVWDLKTGMRPVRAAENWQLLVYASLIDPAGTAPSVELRIVQPHAGGVDSWVVPDMRPYRERIDRAMEEVISANPRLVANPNNCTYCAGIVNCPAARDVTLGAYDQLVDAPVAPLPPESWRSDLRLLRNVRAIVDQRMQVLEATIESTIRAGNKVPGCSLEPSGRAGNLDWKAGPEVVRAVAASYNVDPDKRVLLTPKQLIAAGVPDVTVEKLSARRPRKMIVSTDTEKNTLEIFK